MRLILTAMLVFSLTVAAPFAGCGKKVANEGTLENVDQSNKTIRVKQADGTELTFKLNAQSKFFNAAGEETTGESLMGKEIDTSTEHDVLDTAKEKS